MNNGKRGLWVAALVAVLAIGGIGYYAMDDKKETLTTEVGVNTPKQENEVPNPLANAKPVDLNTFNSKEKELTDEAVKIYEQIKAKTEELKAGTITPEAFKTAMTPLNDQMKANWDEYKKFTENNALSDEERNSPAFKEGVQIASSMRLDAYTFLINATNGEPTKDEILASYEQNLAQFETKLETYRSKTKA
ncbi:hypothetical protein OS242_06035 [Tumebacillus sp. DT12]|uniref:Uncharacterized protein n=1 Tax=Tumebacillus lacus TaxID=2995335 RepID=A0ABT3X1S7_9BACL|nr:hypothetical protein [Tumebacillus lacus]MCX7569515.1 hypothetical protein [Tumebacillus lacus]